MNVAMDSHAPQGLAPVRSAFTRHRRGYVALTAMVNAACLAWLLLASFQAPMAVVAPLGVVACLLTYALCVSLGTSLQRK